MLQKARRPRQSEDDLDTAAEIAQVAPIREQAANVTWQNATPVVEEDRGRVAANMNLEVVYLTDGRCSPTSLLGDNDQPSLARRVLWSPQRPAGYWSNRLPRCTSRGLCSGTGKVMTRSAELAYSVARMAYLQENPPKSYPKFLAPF
jgi:hypothetical protein